MLGAQVGQQEQLFYEFNLEDVIPKDHLLRKIDTVLDLSWLRSELSSFYSHTGRPSVDPELMIRMLLIGYCYSIRSERQLCQEVKLNLAYRWFCRLGLEDKIPDHSTFSVNRHGRFRASDVLRTVFEHIVHQCMDAGTDEQQTQRPVREYLDALEGERSPTNPKRKPKAISPTDPSAAWTIRGRNKVMFGYSLNYLIDMENAVILDVEATPTRISKEVEVTETLLMRTQKRFGLKPGHIAGDVAYGSGRMLGWLERHEIDPHIPVWDKGKRDDGTLSRDDFTFYEDRNLYLCPQGNELKTTGTVHDGKTLLYRASKYDCDICPLKEQCCPRTPSRKIPRDINEAARDRARSLNGTEAYNQSACNRKKIERLFGEAKQNLSMTRLRLRGLSGAKDEFLLTATVQNLKRLAKFILRPPPISMELAHAS